MSTDARIEWPAPKERAAELSDKLRLVRDALSLDLGNGVDVVDGARACREERDQLRLELSRLEAENARIRELEGDAVTLRGYIARYGETPMMTHSRAEAAESKLSALIEENARLKEERLDYERRWRDIYDIPLARLQLPDGSVPGGTVECAEAWHRIARERGANLSALIASVREIARELGEFSRPTGWDDRPGWRICKRWRDALQQAIGDK